MVIGLILGFSVCAYAQVPVNSVLDLWNVRSALGGSYLQGADIDLARTDPDILDDYPYTDNTNYVVGDIVLYLGYANYCKTAHNSGTAFVPANWVQMWEWQKGWAPLGTSQTNPFYGIYDGGNKKISNLYINRGPTTSGTLSDPVYGDYPYWTDGEDNVGLFGFVTNANGGGTGTTYDVYVKNVVVYNPRVTGRRGTGAIIGKVLLPETSPARSYTVITQNCSSQAGTGSYVKGFGATGGVIGANNSTARQRVPILRLCWSNVDVSSTHPTNTWINPNDYFGSPRKYNPFNIKYGGVVGCNENGVTQDSYGRGDISGGDRVGGLAGCTIGGSIFRSYGTGDLTRGITPGDWQGGWGGLVGLTSGSLPPGLGGTNQTGSVANGYWLEKSGVSYTTTYTASRTDAQFLAQGSTATNFPNWDFTNVWGYESGVNGNYPILRSSPILAYYYRSTATGNWSDVSTWQRSTDNTNWSAATLVPDESNSITILIQSPHSVTLNQNVLVDAMTIASGGTVIIGTGYTMLVENGDGIDLSIVGSLTVTGTFTVGQSAQVTAATNSTITYNGNAAQSIGSGFPSPVYNLIINNLSGVSVGAEISVDGTFTLTNGSYSGGSGFHVDGLYSPTVKFLSFPTTNYNILGYSASTNTGNANMRYIKRQWDIAGNIDNANDSNRTKTITFYWTTDDDYDYTWGSTVPFVYAGEVPINPGVGDYSLTGASRWVRINYIFPQGAKASEHFMIGLDENETLPVELSGFTAMLSIGNGVQLQWITQSETNLSGYRIYRGTSEELEAATMLDAFIEGSNTSQTQTYVYNDHDIYEPGTYYYWLESLDFDGSNSFFGPAIVRFNPDGEGGNSAPVAKGLDSIYPNPFNPSTTIRYGLTQSGAVKLDIYNLRGQLIRSTDRGNQPIGYHSYVWNGTAENGQRLGSGVYLIRVSIDRETWTQKVLLLK